MSNQNPSMTKLENDIVSSRDRLAQTIDELADRAAPKNLITKQKESAKASFDGATRTEGGELRMDRIAIAAAVVGGIVLLKVISSARGRSKKKKMSFDDWEKQRENRSW